jgi:hypothetical protein
MSHHRHALVLIIALAAAICSSQTVLRKSGISSPESQSRFFGNKTETKKVSICVPEIENRSTRSINLDFLRQRLIKLLDKKNATATASQGTATHPDCAQVRDAGCDYLLKVEIRELRLETRQPGITIGAPRTPDVAEPESLNKRYTARLDFELTQIGNTEPLVDSVANGESDSELQAAANAADLLANRVLSELKKNK